MYNSLYNLLHHTWCHDGWIHPKPVACCCLLIAVLRMSVCIYLITEMNCQTILISLKVSNNCSGKPQVSVNTILTYHPEVSFHCGNIKIKCQLNLIHIYVRILFKWRRHENVGTVVTKCTTQHTKLTGRHISHKQHHDISFTYLKQSSTYSTRCYTCFQHTWRVQKQPIAHSCRANVARISC